MLLLSLLTLAVLQGVVVRSLSFFGPDSRYFDGAIQYCDLGGGPLVTHVNVVFSMWEFQGNQEMHVVRVLFTQGPVSPCF